VAARAHLQRLLPVIDEALRTAGLKLDQINSIAVHNMPGLVGALLVGVSAAKMLALALEVPLVAVNHIESHVYACRLAAGRDIFPCVGLVVSGGPHYPFSLSRGRAFRASGRDRGRCRRRGVRQGGEPARARLSGRPGRGARGGQRQSARLRFPRSFLHDRRLDFSFSGLKTAVRYALAGVGARKVEPPPPGPFRADLAASFQEAVVEVLTAKCRQALRKTRLNRLAVGGGVAANGRLRSSLEEMAKQEQAELFIPPLRLCTDNAAMAAVAVEKWRLQQWAAPDLDAIPTVM